MVSCQECDRERRCVLEFSGHCGRCEGSRLTMPCALPIAQHSCHFWTSRCCGSHRVILSLFWNKSSALGVVYTTLSAPLKVQLECAVDTMQDICWQAPMAGFEWCHSTSTAFFLNLNCLALCLPVWSSAQILDGLGRTPEPFNYLLWARLMISTGWTILCRQLWMQMQLEPDPVIPLV